MKKALVVYNSKTGVTKLFADEINNFLIEKKLESRVISINEFQERDLNNVNMLFLGAWTHGLFVIFQHPEKKWVEFAKKLPELDNIKVGLFTTYKISVGSMFKKMINKLKGETDNIKILLKSKNGVLSEDNKNKIKQLLK